MARSKMLVRLTQQASQPEDIIRNYLRMGTVSKGHYLTRKRALYQRIGAAPPDPPTLSIQPYILLLIRHSHIANSLNIP